MQPQPPQPYAPVIIKLLQGAIYNDDPHWERLQSYLTPIKEYFGKIGLQVQNYDTEGFAYLEQPDPEPEERTEPLPRLTVRRQLSFTVTVFCVLLRDQLRQFDASDAIGKLILSIEQIRDLLQPYLPEENNEDRFRREVEGLIKQTSEFGFLKRLSGQDENYEVRPILKAKIDADTLELLKQKLETYANPTVS
ncbi:DUF4194 domain-containing protein [Aliterella atlantica]|uniref:DUF4194 domain-containing protein n=1 Tax=Aliterella atlantica CENA595 TaxID=1618023 RepID=A0A0D8ZQE0_9CYAN|nr:DUF4194 domain-containing protein [Aliterella atlantica]KJH70567.1 hypothetical protein UH38_17520 [Aliterella atlantica CENA595]